MNKNFFLPNGISSSKKELSDFYKNITICILALSLLFVIVNVSVVRNLGGNVVGSYDSKMMYGVNLISSFLYQRLGGGFDGEEKLLLADTDTISPTVQSITLVGPINTNQETVDFVVTFSEPVIGVDMIGPDFDDFALTTSLGISGAHITNISGSDDVYVVTVNTGSGDGTLRLDVVPPSSR
jgi:hypothetical protein